jgi:hypothetical protein
MKTALIGLALAATLGGASLTSPTPANAGCFGCAVGAGVFGGLVAGAVIGSAIANNPPPPTAYYPPATPAACYWTKRQVWNGYSYVLQPVQVCQ